MCSHRGVQLGDGAQKLSGMLCCPSHSWTYDLTVRLVATPHVGGINTHQVDGLDR
ncbi:MAG TPA: 2Fe-2S ferredoxin, partial [Gammaproteobacteria bacterium]|nr:2Fe-2S ferredoxin [Gammaproteobacteria bacterium]